MAVDEATTLTQYELYIDGEIVAPAAGGYLESVNPATAEPWYRFADAGTEDVDRAVKAARRALDDPKWRDISPVERGRLLRRIADALQSRGDALALIETTDNGKLIREMRLQHRNLPALWEYYAGWPDKLHGELVPSDPTIVNYLRREPVGVVAAIVPWNSPLNIASNKLAPALAAGNAVVLKPSEHTSASMLEFVSVLEEAGVPPGVVNVVTGLGEGAGAALVNHPGVDLITFTGGTDTGRSIAAAAAKRPIRALLELGGKSPNIVFPDADLEHAAMGIVAGIFAAAGQTCVAGSRCFVHEDVYDEVLARVEERTARISLGDPLDESTDVGPVAFREQMDKVLGYIELGVGEGAAVRIGGARSTRAGLENGFYVEPTILENVDNDMRVVREEIFGPVLSVLRFRDDEEVLAIANDSPYGLAAGVWTRDISRAHRFAQRLEAGTVWLNTYRAMSPLSPFGGFKHSGYGKESGKEAMFEYTRMKSVWLSIADGPAPDPFVMRM